MYWGGGCLFNLSLLKLARCIFKAQVENRNNKNRKSACFKLVNDISCMWYIYFLYPDIFTNSFLSNKRNAKGNFFRFYTFFGGCSVLVYIHTCMPVNAISLIALYKVSPTNLETLW